MRIKAIDITPDGDLIVIGGRNAQGKTSVLQAIWFALGGGPAQRTTTRPIRDGEHTATVTLDLGDMLVTRTWTGDKTTLKVTATDGATYPSPQKMLDTLVGRLSFDPLTFSHQDEKSQRADLLALVDLPFDPAELEGRRTQVFDARAEVGRSNRLIEGQLAGLPDTGPVERISIADTLTALDHAEDAARTRSHCERDRNVAHNAAADAEQQIVELAKVVSTHHAATNRLTRELAAMPAPVDTAVLRARLAEAEEVNRAADRSDDRARLDKSLADGRTQYVKHTQQLESLAAEQAAGLTAAVMPVEGLSFDADGVLLNGVPFRQCSAAERLRVSLAMAIAMNPKIRVIRITDGSLLDRENLALIQKMAEDNDFQVWIERVEDDNAQFVIEDGEVA